MEYGAIDLHLRRRHIRIEDERGTVVVARRIDTTRPGIEEVFDGRPRMRILVESATESEWVAPCLEGLGHEVLVADPNYAPMYGQRNRRIKTDTRDVTALCAACRTGMYRPASRVSAAQRARRQELRVRRHVIQVRTRTINLMRALVRQEGGRVPPARVPPSRAAGSDRPSACPVEDRDAVAGGTDAGAGDARDD